LGKEILRTRKDVTITYSSNVRKIKRGADKKEYRWGDSEKTAGINGPSQYWLKKNESHRRRRVVSEWVARKEGNRDKGNFSRYSHHENKFSEDEWGNLFTYRACK